MRPSVPAGAHPLLHHIARAIDDLDVQIATLTERRAKLDAELREKLARAAVPSEV